MQKLKVFQITMQRYKKKLEHANFQGYKMIISKKFNHFDTIVHIKKGRLLSRASVPRMELILVTKAKIYRITKILIWRTSSEFYHGDPV